MSRQTRITEQAIREAKRGQRKTESGLGQLVAQVASVLDNESKALQAMTRAIAAINNLDGPAAEINATKKLLMAAERKLSDSYNAMLKVDGKAHRELKRKA